MTLGDLQSIATRMEMYANDALYDPDVNVVELGQDLLLLVEIAKAAKDSRWTCEDPRLRDAVEALTSRERL